MRAALIQEPGKPPVVVDCQEPTAENGNVLVRVTAAPISPLDLLCASGTSYFGVPRTPYVPGVQGVGVLDDEPVWFATTAGMEPGDGSMAAVAAVAEADVIPLPSAADPMHVAALGLAGIAAYMALTWRGELEAGEQVLVLGAGGAVGQIAVQIAKTMGARRVIAGARSVGARARAKGAGADAIVALDTDDVDELTARLTAACDGPIDLVLDPLFGAPAAAATRVLRQRGRLVNLGSSAAETCTIDSSTLRSRSLRLLGYTNLELTREQRRDALAAMIELVSTGALRVEHELVALDDATRAWARQAAGFAAGRIVLVPQPPRSQDTPEEAAA